MTSALEFTVNQLQTLNKSVEVLRNPQTQSDFEALHTIVNTLCRRFGLEPVIISRVTGIKCGHIHKIIAADIGTSDSFAKSKIWEAVA